MNQYLYDIFQTSEKNNCADLTIALAMFLCDAREGRQQYGPDGLDYAALHQDCAALADAEGGLRRFIGRHSQELAEAYQSKDRALFHAAVAACETEDLAAEHALKTSGAES